MAQGMDMECRQEEPFVRPISFRKLPVKGDFAVKKGGQGRLVISRHQWPIRSAALWGSRT